MKQRPYPSWTCAPCGNKHGSRSKKFPSNHTATWHYGKCDVCEKNAFVTEPRDFGHFPRWFDK
jgi:hypothetical protein